MGKVIGIDYSGKQTVWLAVVLWLLYLFFVLLHQQATHYQMPGCTFHCPQWLLECSQLTLRLMALGHTFFGIRNYLAYCYKEV